MNIEESDGFDKDCDECEETAAWLIGVRHHAYIGLCDEHFNQFKTMLMKYPERVEE